jgi:TetR/AcrR family tetracycline transcriptional repressor
VERIVGAALEIVDREGADALSMRSLAERLGSGTATLYRHFPNRAALVSHVVDLIFSEAELATKRLGNKKGWEEICRAIAHVMFDTLVAHRNMTPMLVEHVPVGPRAMAFREQVIGNLRAQGFPLDLALRFYATLARYVLGFAIQAGGAADDQDDELRVADVLGASVAMSGWSPISLREEFAFGLDLILLGMRQERAAPSR